MTVDNFLEVLISPHVGIKLMDTYLRSSRNSIFEPHSTPSTPAGRAHDAPTQTQPGSTQARPPQQVSSREEAQCVRHVISG